MKIMIIANSFYPEADATANCLKNLLDYLPDCEKNVVSLLGKSTAKQKYNDVTVYYIHNNTLKKALKAELKKRTNILPLILVAFELLYKKFMRKLFKKSYHKTAIKYRCRIAAGEIQEIVKKENPDVLISVCQPPETLLLRGDLNKINPDMKWIVYYFDPFCTNACCEKSRRVLERLEYKLLENADKIILTDLIYKDYAKTSLNKYLSKSVVLELPCIKRLENRSKEVPVKFDAARINCLFIGNFYKKLREPDFLFKLIEAANDSVCLYSIGSYFEYSKNDVLSIKRRYNGSKIKFLPSVPLDVAHALMNNADILVNVGNTMENQMPSKILDYISAGKPILNICKSGNCPTLKYINKYPLSLNLFESDGITKEIIEKVETFCSAGKGHSIPYEEIEEIYSDCTAQAVSKQFAEVLNGLNP